MQIATQPTDGDHSAVRCWRRRKRLGKSTAVKENTETSRAAVTLSHDEGTDAQ